MKTKQKVLSVILVTAMVASLVGCSKGTSDSDKSSNTNSASNSSSTSSSESNPAVTKELAADAGNFPIVTDKTKLNILIQQSATTSDYDIADQTKAVEEKTGIDLEWTILPSTADATQKLKLILCSDDLPDIFFNMPGMTSSDIYSLAKQGTFIPLNDYIDSYGVETKKMFNEVEYSKSFITYPDGNIYSLPYINDCYHCNVQQRMFIYKPWLDKLGLSVPTTTDELYNALKAFKEKDPNGNGKSDEIPLAGNTTTAGTVASFLMNAFTYYSINDEYYVDDNGKVIIPYDTNEWKAGLEYMNKLYSEGLIAPESFTQNETQLSGVVKSETETIGAFTNRFSHSVTGWDTGTVGTLSMDYVVVPPLKGPDDYQVAVWRPYSSSNNARFMISSTCKNPEIAFRLGDYLLSQEQTEISIMGLEGKGWKKADAGEVGIDGRPAIYHQIPEAASIPNQGWGVQLPMVATNDFRMSMAATGGDSNLEVSLYKMTKVYEPFKVDRANVIPNLYFSDEDITTLSDLSAITQYVNEATARFITGDMDISKDWDTYLSGLDKMGYKKLVDIYQNAYDIVKKSDNSASK